MKRCGETGKKKYRTKLDALMFSGLVIGRIHGGDQRAYQCPFCDFWHLTTKPQRKAA